MSKLYAHLCRGLTVALLAGAGLCAAAPATPPPALQQVFGQQPYRTEVTTPDSLLGFAHGEQAASPEEIDRALRAWAAQSPRLVVQEYARSHQGRPLSVAIISSAQNIERLPQLQDELDALADPRSDAAADAEAILQRAPAVAYIAHSIHGNETSGADAALALIYHLIANDDAEVAAMLDRTVVIIDPLMNPDGRARAVADLRGFRSAQPSHDGQQMSRGASWPYGRGNHYVFDLNRDWIYGTQPETRGRLQLLQRWHPLLFVDAHEMGAQDTFLFSPPRAPVNPHFSSKMREQVEKFSRDQAQAFDRRGWVYYSGEWNEGWYPGYSDAWGGLRGAVNILYEQARVADHGVRQGNGLVLHYSEGVARQLGSAWANLQSLAANREVLLRDFFDDRQTLVGAGGPYSAQSWVIPADRHPARVAQMVELLQLQGIEVFRLQNEWSPPGSRDLLGREQRRAFAAGSIVVPGGQPLARLVANLFEFDPRIDDASLTREREELLRNGSGTIYDVTSWNLPMMFGLDAYSVGSAAPSQRAAIASGPAVQLPAPSAVGYLIPGHDDGALRAAVALMDAGIRPRVALKPVQFDGQHYPRGSLVVSTYDHRRLDAAELHAALQSALPHLHQPVVALTSGHGPGDAPDLGGGEFRLLEKPRVAILGKGAISPQEFGFLWHALERGFGVAPTLLDTDAIGRLDLRTYNVIVLPPLWGGAISDAVSTALNAWVEGGGTLVATGNGATALASADGWLQARALPGMLKEPAPYRDQLAREWLASNAKAAVDTALWGNMVASGLPHAWPAELKDEDDADARIRRDQWRRLFMPQGAFVSARCSEHHWLSLGCDGWLPVLVGDDDPLMAAAGVDAPLRLGHFSERSAEGEEWTAYGWGGVPPGQQLHLRIGGLLWPEAQERLANSAHTTRESVGRGQVILIAGSPAFRGASLGMRRVFANAVILGPGLGASQPVLP